MDVYQINEKHGRAGWIGCFVVAEEVKSWGIQGFVSILKDHHTQERAYIRLKFDEIDYIGKAALEPNLDIVGDQTGQE